MAKKANPVVIGIIDCPFCEVGKVELRENRSGTLYGYCSGDAKERGAYVDPRARKCGSNFHLGKDQSAIWKASIVDDEAAPEREKADAEKDTKPEDNETARAGEDGGASDDNRDSGDASVLDNAGDPGSGDGGDPEPKPERTARRKPRVGLF